MVCMQLRSKNKNKKICLFCWVFCLFLFVVVVVLLDKGCCCWEMLNTSANVLCEVVLVSACLFYHTDCNCVWLWMFSTPCLISCICTYAEWAWYPPSLCPPTHTLKTNQWRRPINHNERKNKEKEKTGEKDSKQNKKQVMS